MLRHLALIVFSSLFSAYCSAQRPDSIFVEQGTDGWVIRHSVKKGETIFSIARNYHIPPAMLGDANKLSLQQSLRPGMMIQIPLGAYNLKSDGGMYTDEMRPLYHRLHAGESLKKVAKNSNVNQRRLLDWNDLTADDLFEGMVLKVGWLLYDATGNTLPPVATTLKKDTPVAARQVPPSNQPAAARNKSFTDTFRIARSVDTVDTSGKSEAELLYEDQTTAGIVTERGPAAFFKTNNKNANFYYAFHNEAPKGTIIKVRNTNNGKSVYVKVLGPIPNTSLYHKAIIGISSRARTVLEVSEEKAWCELTYGR